MMHAENGIAIDVLVEQALARGRDRPALPRRGPQGPAGGRGHPPRHQARPGRRGAAVRRARLGDGGGRRAGPGPRRGAQRLRRDLPAVPVPVHRQPRRARTSRAPSTCAPRRCGPGSTRPRCGGGCAPTTSRWSPPTTARSASPGQKELGRGDFSKIPNGLPGVENRMDLLHQAVVDGHIRRRRWIEIACATPARMFGLYPRKGTIAPGADADVVIYDPHAEQVDLRRDPPHERRLLARTRAGASPAGSRRCSRAANSSSTGGSTSDTPGTAVYTPRSTCQYLN